MKWWHLVLLGVLSGIGFTIGAKLTERTMNRLTS